MYSYHSIQDFLLKVFKAIGCSPKDAELGADVLLRAELRNIGSHGLIRLKDYISLWEQNRLKSNPDIQIVHETPSTAVVDGDSGLGMLVGDYAMRVAIEKAKNVGTGWVSVCNSNHYGIAGYYTMLALEHDMIGIAMTNANPLVAPTWSTDKLLGTNPISVAIPSGNEPPFVADFATTPIARGKLDVMHRKGEQAPQGFVQDKDGISSTDPNILTQGGAILPLGGDYQHGSHKGYCLGAIVDIFSAVFSGANFGPFVPPSVGYLPVLNTSVGKGTGHFFGAMRIDAFQPKEVFKSQMDKWIQTFKNAKPAQGHQEVLIPGEPERRWEKIRMQEGLIVLDNVMDDLKKIASDLQIEMKIDKA